MKNFLANLDPSKMSPRQLLLGVVGLVAALFLVSVVYSAFGQLAGVNQDKVMLSSTGGGGGAPGMDYGDMASEEMASAPRAAPSPMPDLAGGVGSYDEEDYETKSYNAQIQTSNLDGVCDAVLRWKAESYIVFESETRNENDCHYSFKVERSNAHYIVNAIQALEPRTFNAYSRTVKKQVVRYDSQLAIYLQRQDLLTLTLEDSVTEYDKVMALATDVEDVENLTKIINSKLAAIERLTKDRINLARQIDALAQRSAELADDIEFVQFSVSVEQYEIINADEIKDVWVAALDRFAHNVNLFAQSMSLGLIMNLLVLAQVVLYLFIVLIVAKYTWHLGKQVWNGGSTSTCTMCDNCKPLTTITPVKKSKTVAQAKAPKKRTVKK